MPPDKELSGRDGAVLGLETSLDLFEKLKFEGRRLEPDWHPYDAFNFVVTAWHLYDDWLKTAGSPLARTKRKPHHLSAEMILVLAVLRDLANGSKHLELNPDSARGRKVDAVHTGDTADWYSFFFHENMPGVSVGLSYFSIRVLRNISLRYFSWVFDDSVPASQFPGEITTAIQYCHIPTRGGGPPPALWLEGIEQTR